MRRSGSRRARIGGAGLLLGSVLALATPGASRARQDERPLLAALEAFWKVAFDSPEDPDSARAQKRTMTGVLALRPSPQRLRTLLAARPLPGSVEPGILREHHTVAGQGLNYALVVPDGYRGEPTPVRVLLHGGVMTDDTHAGERGPIDNLQHQPYVSVLPSAWRESTWWQRGQLDGLRRILRRLKRDVNVDENRVTLSGISDGATGAFYVAMRDAAPWANVLDFIGFIAVLGNVDAQGQLHVENLRNLPILTVNTDRDHLYPTRVVNPVLEHLRNGGVPLEIVSVEGYDHTMRWFPEHQEAIERFVAEHPRDPSPRVVTWSTENPGRDNCMAWLCIEELGSSSRDAARDDRLNRIGDQELLPRTRAYGRVDLERDGNTFRGGSYGVRRLRLLLDGTVIDLSELVRVELAGRPPVERRVEPSAEVMLRGYLQDLDRTRLYDAELVLDLP